VFTVDDRVKMDMTRTGNLKLRLYSNPCLSPGIAPHTQYFDMMSKEWGKAHTKLAASLVWHMSVKMRNLKIY
jgi:hypothetical protein